MPIKTSREGKKSLKEGHRGEKRCLVPANVAKHNAEVKGKG